MEHYGEPSYYHVSYRMRAIRDAIMLNLGYIPIYFLALCIYKKPNVVWQYKTTILFAGVVQYLFTLPFTIFNTWIAIAVDQEVETTVFMCTFLRIGSSFFNFISFNSLTAISINRLLLIIFNVNCGLAWNVLFFIIASLPIMVDIVYMFFVSHTTDNVMCGPILFFYEFAPQMIWNGYIFGIPLIAVLLNSTTAGYLYYNKYSAGANASYSQQRKVNELFIAIALLVQSVIPALTMSSTGYRSMQQIYGTKSVAWLDELIEISGTLTTGLNMIASMICIRQALPGDVQTNCASGQASSHGHECDYTNELMIRVKKATSNNEI